MIRLTFITVIEQLEGTQNQKLTGRVIRYSGLMVTLMPNPAVQSSKQFKKTLNPFLKFAKTRKLSNSSRTHNQVRSKEEDLQEEGGEGEGEEEWWWDESLATGGAGE